VTYFAHEIISISLSLLLVPLLIVSAGTLVLHLLPHHTITTSFSQRFNDALLYGLGVITPFLDGAGRLFGPQGILYLALIIIISGALIFIKTISFDKDLTHIKWPLLTFVLWALYICVMLEPFMINKSVYITEIIFDHAKHNAITNAIAFGGTPPPNNVFYTPQSHIIYYYYFHLIPATIMKLGGGLIEARHAMLASCIWLMPILIHLINIIYHKCSDDAERLSIAQRQKWVLIFLITLGLEVIPFIILNVNNIWPRYWYVEIYDPFVKSLSWVPQHSASLIASWVGFIWLEQALRAPYKKACIYIGFAALAFSSCFGMSTYVAIGSALTLLVYVLWRLVQKRPSHIAYFATCGLLTSCLCAPMLSDIASAHAKSTADIPIGFYILGAKMWFYVLENHLAANIISTLLIPPVMIVYMGIFALGTYVYWQDRIKNPHINNDNIIDDLLTLSTALTLFLSLTLKTTILSNDLAWRIRLFAELGIFIWTLKALEYRLFQKYHYYNAFILFLVFGLCSFTYSLFYTYSHKDLFSQKFTPEFSAQLYDQYLAFQWLNEHRPPLTPLSLSCDDDLDVQYGWGLFSHASLIFADNQQPLVMGASKQERDKRRDIWQAIYHMNDTNLAAVQQLTHLYHVYDIIVQSTDPIWSSPHGWTKELTPVYENSHMRIYHFDEAF
jgi:hypothetical protein